MAATKKPRLKLDRRLLYYVLPAIIIPTILFLIAAKGADLGQSEQDAKRALEEQAIKEKQLNARVENPDEAAERDARFAREEQARKEAAALEAQRKALPPAPDIDEESRRRQLEDLNRTRDMVAGDLDASERQGVFGKQTVVGGKKSFLAYRAPVDEKLLKKSVDATEEALSLEKKKSAEAEEPFIKDGNEKVEKFKNTVTAERIDSKYWLSPGTVIKGVLLNAVDTRIAGQITARITEPVYDSRYGKYLVIPAGSRLIGQYGSDVAHGQERVLMAFSSLVTPSGGVIDLSGMRASDALGRGGIPGQLHTHFWQRMGVATLFALESIGLNRLANSKTTVENNGQTTTTENGSSDAAQIIMDAAKQDPRLKPITPNITIEEGQIISIVTTVSIDVPPVANKR